ncbi:MAG: hypothetical protein JST38_04280 [Bacteroidetes bacterium]|nr:hypothetical protein [Bacteroidota bacterium]MBS1940077.1 hypothetical protein [Bacteroidota bacterium]
MKGTLNIKWAVAVAALTIASAACNAQNKKSEKSPARTADAALPVDSPKVNVRVNKVYDDQGNLVRYDSTYTSVYNGMGGDSLRMDSLMQQFMGQFNGPGGMGMMGPGMNNLFFNDSLLGYDFFHNDFFQKRMELNQRYMQDMMQRMDSLKNQFFIEPPPSSQQDHAGTL